MMQVDVENTFNNVFRTVVFKNVCDVEWPLINIVPFIRLFYGVHSSFYFHHGWHVEGVTIIESFSSTRQGDPLGGLLFALAHYQDLLETIARAPNYVFPFLVDDNHIMGPINEITYAFDHLSAQLALVGLRVKVSKCKLWSPLGLSLGINILLGCTLVTYGLRILGVLVGFQDFATHFLDETLSLNVANIDDFLFLENAWVALGILSSCVICRPYYFTRTILLSFSFLSLLEGFDKRIM
jgi:hypothetical protein